MQDLLRISLIVVLLASGCGLDDGWERRRAWREVQELRTAWLDAPPESRTAAKQRWADEVRAFLIRFPDHPGAVATWNALQLDYAEQLEANGRFVEAETHYRSLLDRSPGNQRASEGVQRVARRLRLSEDDFRSLRPGLSRGEVARMIGLPRPGWDRSDQSDGELFESWYYRGVDGRIRGVHFKEGILFGVDLP